ncbi:MAG: hypothetical protein ACYTFG_00615 [Planctomycetota bacterium]|jgi:hypothetical protein
MRDAAVDPRPPLTLKLNGRKRRLIDVSLEADEYIVFMGLDEREWHLNFTDIVDISLNKRSRQPIIKMKTKMGNDVELVLIGIREAQDLTVAIFGARKKVTGLDKSCICFTCAAIWPKNTSVCGDCGGGLVS